MQFFLGVFEAKNGYLFFSLIITYFKIIAVLYLVFNFTECEGFYENLESMDFIKDDIHVGSICRKQMWTCNFVAFPFASIGKCSDDDLS